MSATDIRGSDVESGSEHRPASGLLFRPEIMEARRDQWLGTVLLTPRRVDRGFGLFAASVCLALGLFAAMASYTRTVRVDGWVVPASGVVSLSAPVKGAVEALHVRAEQIVEAGAPLVSISGEIRSGADTGVRQQAASEIAERRQRRVAERSTQSLLFDQQDTLARQQLVSLSLQEEKLREELRIQVEKVRLAEAGLARVRAMRRQDLVPVTRLEQAEQELLEQKSRRQTIERSLNALRQETSVARSGLKDLPLRRQLQLNELDRSISSLNQELLEAEVMRTSVVTAPRGGVVSNIQIEVGSNVAEGAPVLQIVPMGAQLLVHLYAPSKAVGLVRPGQSVQLRYAAFPYQKFGSYSGTISSISASAVTRPEMAQKTAGLANGAAPNEPLYRVEVMLDQQAVTSAGRVIPIKPGMQVEANITVETKRLYQWMLEPVYPEAGIEP